MAIVEREALLESFRSAWPEGHEEMVEVAFAHYMVRRASRPTAALA